MWKGGGRFTLSGEGEEVGSPCGEGSGLLCSGGRVTLSGEGTTGSPCGLNSITHTSKNITFPRT